MKMLLLIISLITIQASASECKYLPSAKIDQALSLLKEFKDKHSVAVVDLYCEACLDKSAKPIVIDNISLENFQVNGYKAIKINNKAVDLAHLYLLGESVSHRVGCRSRTSSRFL